MCMTTAAATIIAALLIALAIICLVAFPQPANNGVAKKKAEQLEQLLQREGLPIPSTLKVLTNAPGTNGGAVCKGSGYNLTDAIFNQQLAAGGGVGRPPAPRREGSPERSAGDHRRVLPEAGQRPSESTSTSTSYIS